MAIVWTMAALCLFVGGISDAPKVEIADSWKVRVSPGEVAFGKSRVKIANPIEVKIDPADEVQVTDERYDSLPIFNDGAAPWTKGARLNGLIAFETTAPDALIKESVVVKPKAGDATPFKLGVDYRIEDRWATIGRIEGGAIAADQPVWISYRYGTGRIDSIVVDKAGAVSALKGTSNVATPHPPRPLPNEYVLSNVWIPGRLPALSQDQLYPILEPRYPERHPVSPPAEKLLPKTWEKLKSGEALHVLAWGDSVTAGGQASDEAHRYQDRFVALLKQRFPKAQISLTTAGWGGRNSDDFLKQPPGAPYNFEETVIGPHPDLVVMEFVNDSYLSPDQVETRYSSLEERFKAAGAEWIIVTPHFVRPDWMGASSARVESDPRPYVAGLRQFAEKHRIALADASLRWGHLLKEGIPYVTLLCNCINHPDNRGHELFAQALMELFGV